MLSDWLLNCSLPIRAALSIRHLNCALSSTRVLIGASNAPLLDIVNNKAGAFGTATAQKSRAPPGTLPKKWSKHRNLRYFLILTLILHCVLALEGQFTLCFEPHSQELPYFTVFLGPILAHLARFGPLGGPNARNLRWFLQVQSKTRCKMPLFGPWGPILAIFNRNLRHFLILRPKTQCKLPCLGQNTL